MRIRRFKKYKDFNPIIKEKRQFNITIKHIPNIIKQCDYIVYRNKTYHIWFLNNNKCMKISHTETILNIYCKLLLFSKCKNTLNQKLVEIDEKILTQISKHYIVIPAFYIINNIYNEYYIYFNLFKIDKFHYTFYSSASNEIVLTIHNRYMQIHNVYRHFDTYENNKFEYMVLFYKNRRRNK